MYHHIIIDRKQAFSGNIGKQREEFCAGFSRRKQESFRRIESEISDKIFARGETTTCRKGCSVCCVLYIEANIQECEAIAYYLYEHPQVLNSFLDRYERWREIIRGLGSPFSLCDRILHQRSQEKLTGSDQTALLSVLRRYQEQNIPCSFLDDRVCSIYEVRPYVCANHFVTTPEAWCRSENWCNSTFPSRPKIYMTTIDEINDFSFYHRSLGKPVMGFMPTTVYRILTEGLNYIADATGLENLRSSL